MEGGLSYPPVIFHRGCSRVLSEGFEGEILMGWRGAEMGMVGNRIDGVLDVVVTLISSSTSRSFDSWLRADVEKARSFDIIVGFLSSEGLEFLVELL